MLLLITRHDPPRRRSFRPLLLAFALAAALHVSPARADGSAMPLPAVALTVSGGVSLGAYEAGFLHYALATALRGRMMDLRLVTGASAGSLNALLAVLAACGTNPGHPESSLAWRTWIPTGFDQLFTPRTASALGAFSREWLQRGAGPLEEAWSRGLDERCDVVLGVSTTRVKPRTIRASGLSLALPSLEEKFAIRIQGRGPGVPPRATNYADPRSGGASLLVTDDRGEVAFSELRDLVFASMAFPVLFPPQEVRTCASGEGTAPGICRASEAEVGMYVDGGVLDNAPLRLAVRLARAGLLRTNGGRLEWRDTPSRDAATLPAGLALVFVDPEVTAYPPPLSAEEPDIDSLSQLVRAIAVGFVDAARSKELVTLIEEHPEIAQRVLLPQRHFPAASSPLFALLGFFESDFRIFDFHLGMYDARKVFEGEVAARRAAAPTLYPEPREPSVDVQAGGWTPFVCLRAVYDGVGSAADACGPDALHNFRALVQVSLDKLYSTCSSAPGNDERIRWTEHCSRAARGSSPPRVPGVPGAEGDWRRRGTESDLEHTLRLLAAHGFEYHDLQVPPGRPDLAMREIRRSLGRAAEALADAQPTASGRFTVGRAGKLAADLVTYSPPIRVLHVTTGPTETELGITTRLPDWDWLPGGLRFTGVVGLRGLDDVLSSGGHDAFGFLPTAGMGFDPFLLSTMWTQLHLGARAGWLFASGDSYGTASCMNGGASHVTACSRPVVQGFVALTMFERLRVQLVGEWFPALGDRVTAWSVSPGLGLELGF